MISYKMQITILNSYKNLENVNDDLVNYEECKILIIHF